MVKVGFIVEGDTEKLIVESPAFVAWLVANGMSLVTPVVNAKGGGNLLPQNIGPFIATLQRAQAEHIVILTDLENEANPATVRTRIGKQHTNLIFIAVKAIEAWFLADTQALRQWLKIDTVEEPTPEQTLGMPWQRLKEIARENNKRGPGDNKLIFARRMIKHYGFTVSNAAQHSNCPSVVEFADGIVALGSTEKIIPSDDSGHN
jgi:hypothetical protein